MQGFIPKNIDAWALAAGEYAAAHILNIAAMKESLLKEEKLKHIHALLDEKVDDFLRNKLKEKIPVFSMFITEGMISKMKEVLVGELQLMVPSLIEQIASGVEEQYNIKRMISDKVNAVSIPEMQNLFLRYAGKSITTLKMVVAVIGFALGIAEVLIVTN